MPLSRKDQCLLEGKINAAAEEIHLGHLAWQELIPELRDRMLGASIDDVFRAAAREYCDDRLAAVSLAQRFLAAQIAHFEDKDPALNVCPHVVMALGNYEAMACALIEGITSLKGDRQEELLKTPTGKWAVKRRLHIGGRDYQEATVCTNPAVGTAHLDKWEHELRSSAFVTCEPAQITV